MIKGNGRPVYQGVAIGRIYVHTKARDVVNRKCTDIAKELERFEEARESARKELEVLYDKTLNEIGEEQAGIIEVQSLFLDDLDYIEGIQDMIRQGSDAAFSVHEIGDAQASAFAALDDEYMKARATDIRDISDRLVRILTGADQGFRMDEPGIIVAEDLTPSETVALDKDKILAFVTRQGSSNSHTAILARVMNIPSLVLTDIDIDPSLNGRTIIVDGFAGNYYIDPDDATMKAMQDKKRSAGEYKASLEGYRGRESVTRKGQKVSLFANIGSPDDIRYVIEGDAEGIGLLRSEFLYLGRDDFPTEDELFEAYRKVVEAMDGRKVVIRTLDIGADKKVDYFRLEPEENPGPRGDHVPDDHLPQGGRGHQGLLRRGRRRTRGRRHQDIPCRARHHDRDACRSAHQRHPGAARRLLQRRDQRPDAVHSGDRPAEREAGRFLRCAPPRAHAFPGDDRRERAQGGHLGRHMRRACRRPVTD